MSEYQYYELQAIDRPLTAMEMSDLRSYSTRARITQTSFVNESSWGPAPPGGRVPCDGTVARRVREARRGEGAARARGGDRQGEAPRQPRRPGGRLSRRRLDTAC